MCTGQCRIENTPKGWFISLIKEEDKIERERRLKRERAEKGEEERKWVSCFDLQSTGSQQFGSHYGDGQCQLLQAARLRNAADFMTHLYGSALSQERVPARNVTCLASAHPCGAIPWWQQHLTLLLRHS